VAIVNKEGIIKFQLDFHKGPPPPEALLRELNAWRAIFFRLGLLGQDPARYEGLGFGNLSRRLPGVPGDAFLISGTQTGHLPCLLPQHYATVQQCIPADNSLEATGSVKPSSEALSHGILYHCSPNIQWVMHLHSADIFNFHRQLELPHTNPTVDYGTPDMAAEIQRLVKSRDEVSPGLIIMTGHQDGIIAYGNTAEETGSLVVNTLARALQFS
jgi:ribulose-5-phosphate 4-epimerase/fuculose-1-phosphate aldolase